MGLASELNDRLPGAAGAPGEGCRLGIGGIAFGGAFILTPYILLKYKCCLSGRVR